MRKILLMGMVLATAVALAACNATPEQVEQVEQAVGTVQSMDPMQRASLVATVQAIAPEALAAFEQSAAANVYEPLTQEQINEIVANVDAAREQYVAGGQAAPASDAPADAPAAAPMAASGERVNATEQPAIAPRIVYFFASAASQAAMDGGVRYYLNWTTENANRVEIFGTVMDNPVQGSWPVYNESNDWVLWAANDQAWVEQFMQVQPDSDLGGSPQNVTVNSNSIMLTFRDPQFVDGDRIDVVLNGVLILDGYFTEGRHVSFPITLNSGENSLVINARDAGITWPLVTEFSFSNVVSGPAVQFTRAMSNGDSLVLSITAP